MSAWWFLTFNASEIKDKVQYLTGIEMLYDTIQPDQITIPQFILTNDKKVRNRFTHHLYQNPVLVSVWLYIPCAAHVNVHTVGLAMAYVFVNTSIFYIFHFLSPLPHSWMAQIITDLCTSQLLARKRDFKWELLLRHSSYYTCMTDTGKRKYVLVKESMYW